MDGMTPPPSRDQIIQAAQGANELVADAQANDPALYALLTSQNAKYSWAPVVGSGIAWASTHWGLGLSAEASSFIAGAIILVGTAACHWAAARIALNKPAS